ncbi:MAG TPA: divalent-cation tolerance protein CutA [Gammaproteobacteria bacterium]|nr:divalent-cation tolerance protein CutA [Gammaproteobacteria bacterium]
MSNDSPYLIVFSTCPDERVAEHVAETLIDRRQAACVNIIPKIRSIYHWKGNIERDWEVLLLIKTHKAQFQALEDTIVELHPYELPEIVAVSLETGLADYLRWIDSTLEPEE